MKKKKSKKVVYQQRVNRNEAHPMVKTGDKNKNKYEYSPYLYPLQLRHFLLFLLLSNCNSDITTAPTASDPSQPREEPNKQGLIISTSVSLFLRNVAQFRTCSSSCSQIVLIWLPYKCKICQTNLRPNEMKISG